MKDDLQKSDSCGLKSERKKILTSSTCSLACLSTNLGAFCPMVVHLPSEKSILPYFSGPRGVAISVPFPEVRNRKGAESGLLCSTKAHIAPTVNLVAQIRPAKPLFCSQVPTIVTPPVGETQRETQKAETLPFSPRVTKASWKKLQTTRYVFS